jgi:uncharacterized protein (TIGR02391 family)
VRWDDLQLLRLVDDLEQSGQIGDLANGLNLMQRVGGSEIDWNRDLRPFAHELMMAEEAGYMTWKELQGRFVGNPTWESDPNFWLQQIMDIRLTLDGRDRARGRIIQRPLPDPDDDDDRLISGMTLEEVARAVADTYTDRQLPRYLSDSGVPTEFLTVVDGQSKWEYVMAVLERLHDGGSAARRTLREFVGGWLEGRHHEPPRDDIRKRITALLAQQGWHVRDHRLVIGEKTHDAAGILTPLGRDVRVAALHPAVRQVADRYIEINRMEVAIFEAFKAVINRVKAMADIEGDGTGLMGQVFSDKDPVLMLSDLTTPTGRDIQNGYKFLFMGAAQGIRNPDAHEQFKALGPEEGMEELAFASLLMRRLDVARNAGERTGDG